MHVIAVRSRASESLQVKIVAHAVWNKPRLVDAAFLLGKRSHMGKHTVEAETGCVCRATRRFVPVVADSY
jgi:hypothetical protein